MNSLFRNISGRFPFLKQAIFRLIDSLPGNIRWRIAQKAEFKFHKNDQWRRSEKFTLHNEELLKGFGFNECDYLNKTIIDMGAGSRLRSKFFKGAEIIAIEPLADMFMKNLDYCDLDEAAKVYSKAAEEFIAELQEKADLILCINVLDHVENPKKILHDSFFYLKESGLMLLSVDIDDDRSLPHPIHFTPEGLRAMIKSEGFIIEKTFQGLPRKNQKSYGGGLARTFFLRKR